MAAVLYAIDNTGDELWRVDPVSPGSSVRVGPFPARLTIPGGITSLNGVVYIVEISQDELWRIDLDDPSASVVVGSLPAGITSPQSLAEHGGKLYCADLTDRQLWEIDPTNPSGSTLLGVLPAGLPRPQCMASHGGTLYTVDLQGRGLWSVNISNPGLSSQVGTLPAGITQAQGLASHDGTLYVSDSGGDALWRVDVANPSASVEVGSFPAELETPKGIASHDVPDPVTPDPTDPYDLQASFRRVSAAFSAEALVRNIITLPIGAPNESNTTWARFGDDGFGDVSRLAAVSGETVRLISVNISRQGVVQIRFNGTGDDSGTGLNAGPELSDVWERNPSAITIVTPGIRLLTIPGPNFSGNSFRDPTEPYAYNVGLGLGQDAWWTDFANLTQEQKNATQIILSDVPFKDVEAAFTRPSSQFSATLIGDISPVVAEFTRPSTAVAEPNVRKFEPGHEEVQATFPRGMSRFPGPNLHGDIAPVSVERPRPSSRFSASITKDTPETKSLTASFALQGKSWSVSLLNFVEGVLFVADPSNDELWRVNFEDSDSTAGLYGKAGDLPGGLESARGLTSHEGHLYCIDSNGDELWLLNPGNPAETSGTLGLVGALPAALSSPQGLASHRGGLYCVDAATARLWRINPNNPSDVTSPYGFVGQLPSGLTSPYGLTDHGRDLYCLDDGADGLWLVNAADPADETGSFGLVGALPAGLDRPAGLASIGGSLFCVDLTGLDMWRINIATPSDSTGVYGRLGALPAGIGRAAGMASHPLFNLAQAATARPVATFGSPDVAKDTPGHHEVEATRALGARTWEATASKDTPQPKDAEATVPLGGLSTAADATGDINPMTAEGELGALSWSAEAIKETPTFESLEADEDISILDFMASITKQTPEPGSVFADATRGGSSFRAEIHKSAPQIVALTERQARILIGGHLYNTEESPDRISKVRYDQFDCKSPLNGVPTASLELIDTGVRLNYRERQIDAQGVTHYFPFDRKSDDSVDLSDLIGGGSLTADADVQASGESPGPSLYGSVEMAYVAPDKDALVSNFGISGGFWGLRMWVRLDPTVEDQTLAHISDGGVRHLGLTYSAGAFHLLARVGVEDHIVSAPFDSDAWVLVSAFRDADEIFLGLNDRHTTRTTIGREAELSTSQTLRFGRGLNGHISSLAFMARTSGEDTRRALYGSVGLTRLPDIDIGTSVLVTTSQEPYRDMALRLGPEYYYTCDENGTLVDGNGDVILHDVSGHDRHAVSAHPSLASLSVKGSGSPDIGYLETVGAEALDSPVIAVDALNSGNRGQVSVYEPGGRFEDIDIAFGFKRPNASPGGGILGIYSNDLGLSSSTSAVTQGIPIYLDTSVAGRTRLILKKGAVGRLAGDDAALEASEGGWLHPDGGVDGTKVYNRNGILQATFRQDNGNRGAILEIEHVASGEGAVTWLPDGTRSAAHVNAATEFRYRIVGDGRRLKLFSIGPDGEFLIGIAEFKAAWFPFERNALGGYERPDTVGSYIFFQADPRNAGDNAILFLRFGPRTSLDWRYYELVDTAVRHGGALRARMYSAARQAILYANDRILTGETTAACWVNLEVVGSANVLSLIHI